MFTKLFKKSHDPYELGGRWYKFKVSSTLELLHSDLEGVTMSSSHIIMPKGYYVVEGFPLYTGIPTKSVMFSAGRGVEASGLSYFNVGGSTSAAPLVPSFDVYIKVIQIQ